MTDMKILFLDCDGVLNRRPTREELAGNRNGMTDKEFENAIVGLNPLLVANLKKVVDATDCKIVASTSWRDFDDHPTVGSDWRKTLSEMLGRNKSIFVGKTPNLSECPGWESGEYSRRRGLEIKYWIENNTEPGTIRYCVVDDEVSDIIKDIPRKNVIKTDEMVGMTEEIANKIICVLNN